MNMSKTVAVSMAMKLRKWMAPNFATVETRQDGRQPSPSIAVAELDPSALDELAAAWLDDLYAKAGREVPFHRA